MISVNAKCYFRKDQMNAKNGLSKCVCDFVILIFCVYSKQMLCVFNCKKKNCDENTFLSNGGDVTQT